MMNEPRPQHPFHMDDAIRAQPAAFVEVLRRSRPAAAPVAGRLAACDRLFLVGTGTSFHAARMGEWLLRLGGGGPDAAAVTSFDFALYGPRLTPRDGVVALSHRGHKRYTVAALEAARRAGCATALITGNGAPAAAAHADAVFPTVDQEKSSAHTVSYTTALAVLAALAEGIGRERTGTSPLPAGLLDNDLPAALRAGLETEPTVAALARRHAGRRRLWLTGGGPAAVTAHEAALKIKETSYLQAEGLDVETLLHGPFQCVEAEDLFVLIAPAGPAQERVVEVAGLVREVGAAFVVVSDGTPRALEAGADGWCVVPPLPEPLSALACLVPLQLFAYHLALVRGTNPDGFRLDDPRFARALRLIRL